MIFIETDLKGAFTIDLEPRSDARGFFSRTFCQEEFVAHGLKPVVAQCNMSYNHKRGTLRGLHYQLPPATEAKLIRCVRGAIRSIIVDLRPDSATYLRYSDPRLGITLPLPVGAISEKDAAWPLLEPVPVGAPA